MNSGTFTTIIRGACSNGVHRSRSMVSAVWRARAAGTTSSCAIVALPSTPSVARP